MPLQGEACLVSCCWGPAPRASVSGVPGIETSASWAPASKGSNFGIPCLETGTSTLSGCVSQPLRRWKSGLPLVGPDHDAMHVEGYSVEDPRADRIANVWRSS